jgi:hypothetical protein
VATVNTLAIVHPDILGGRTKDEVQRTLRTMGVRDIGEPELVRALLDEHYRNSQVERSWKDHLDDLRRLMEFLDTHPRQRSLLGNYHILQTADGSWCVPGQVVLARLADGEATGLDSLFDDGDFLSDHYERTSISHRKVIEFAMAVGAVHLLTVEEQGIPYGHPEWMDIRRRAGGSRYTDSSIDRDWTIDDLDDWLEEPSVDLARALWRTMSQRGSSRWLYAEFRRNASYGITRGSSTLVHLLRDAAWVPQGEGFTTPANADVAKLPPGFPVDSGQQWLNEIRFAAEKQREVLKAKVKTEKARELGFDDPDALADAQNFAKLPAPERARILSEAEAKRAHVETQFPDTDPPNPDRVRDRAKRAAGDAPNRRGQTRERTVDLDGEEVRRLAHEYLREVYDDGKQMWCQACQAPVPFLTLKGEPYFEAVQILDGAVLGQHHQDNYLALCANHSAMFRFANGSLDELEQLILDVDTASEVKELVLSLGGNEVPVRLNSKHIIRLQTIVRESRGDID